MKRVHVYVGAIMLTASVQAARSADIIVQLEQSYDVVKTETSVAGKTLTDPKKTRNLWLFRLIGTVERDGNGVQDYRVIVTTSDDDASEIGTGTPADYKFDEQTVETPAVIERDAVILDASSVDLSEPQAAGAQGHVQASRSGQVGGGIGTFLYLLGWYPSSKGHRVAAVGIGTSYMHYQWVQAAPSGDQSERTHATIEYFILRKTGDNLSNDRLTVYKLKAESNEEDGNPETLNELNADRDFIVFDKTKADPAEWYFGQVPFDEVAGEDPRFKDYRDVANNLVTLGRRVVDVAAFESPTR